MCAHKTATSRSQLTKQHVSWGVALVAHFFTQFLFLDRKCYYCHSAVYLAEVASAVACFYFTQFLLGLANTMYNEFFLWFYWILPTHTIWSKKFIQTGPFKLCGNWIVEFFFWEFLVELILCWREVWFSYVSWYFFGSGLWWYYRDRRGSQYFLWNGAKQKSWIFCKNRCPVEVIKGIFEKVAEDFLHSSNVSLLMMRRQFINE